MISLEGVFLEKYTETNQLLKSRMQESYMYKVGVKCIDCHMPPAGKIAEGRPEIFQGDLKSHIFVTDHLKQFPAVEENGKKVNPGYLTVEYSCMRCHEINYNRKWASRFAMFSHTVKITANIKIMGLQRVATYIAFFFAFIALFSGLYLKKYIFASIELNKKKVLTYHIGVSEVLIV